MRFRLSLLLSLALSLPLVAHAQDVPSAASAALERPLPSSTEVGIPDVVLLAGEAIPAAPAPTVFERIMANVGPALADLVSLAVLAGLGFLATFLRAKAAESKAASVALKLTEASRAVVLDLDQRLKPKLKAFLADGVLSDTEKEQLKGEAMETLKVKLPAELMGAASGIFGGFLETYLSGKIEQAVVEKNAMQTGAAVPPSAS